MSNRKIIISNELKEVLKKINSNISTTILKGVVCENILSNPEKNFNYLDLSRAPKGHISYLTQDKITKIEQDDETKNYWNVKMRYCARPGSVIKKIFNSFSGSEIENFTTQFLSIVDPPIYSMSIVKGDDISKYYNHNSYCEQSGSLGYSCMKAVDNSFFDIYVQNPDTINMLVMLNQHDKVMGRAVLWLGENFKVLDRIYVSNDSYIPYFIQWARENKCYYKEYNNWYTPKHLMFDYEAVNKDFEIQLKVSKFEKYPYLDSFKWLNTKTRKIYNFKPKTSHNIITVSDHMGGYLRYDHFDFCAFTNNMYHSNDIVFLEYVNKKAYIGNIVRSKINDTLIFKSHAFYDDDLKDYIFDSEYDIFNKDIKKKSLQGCTGM